MQKKCFEGILETKHNEINEMKRRIGLQNNKVQHLKDEDQKQNNKFKSENTSLNSILEDKKQKIDKLEKDIIRYKKNIKEKTKQLNLIKKNNKQDTYEGDQINIGMNMEQLIESEQNAKFGCSQNKERP